MEWLITAIAFALNGGAWYWAGKFYGKREQFKVKLRFLQQETTPQLLKDAIIEKYDSDLFVTNREN